MHCDTLTRCWPEGIRRRIRMGLHDRSKTLGWIARDELLLECNRDLTMANPFLETPILKSPYECPQRHWELNEEGQTTVALVRTIVC